MGGADGVGVQDEVDAVEHGALVAVGGAPLDEEAALVLAEAVLAGVARAPVRGAFALAELDLPAGHVGEDERVGRAGAAGDEVGAPADEDDGVVRAVGFDGELVEALGVVERVDAGVGEDAEDAVVGEVVGDARVDELDGERGGVLDVDDGPVREGLGDGVLDAREVRAGVGVHDEQGGASGGALGRELGGGGPGGGPGEDAGVGRERHGRLLVVASDGLGRSGGWHERSFRNGWRRRGRRVRAGPRGRDGRGR
nr:hypothetical protein GCM10025732_34720 [Glycomyces mayteni]